MNKSPSQYGFTLVETAIALVIIGVLIGVVLSGQELIENGQINTTIKQMSSLESAIKSFKSTYGTLPGDIQDPTRIRNCSTGFCYTSGNGDGMIGGVNVTVGNENNAMWLHLAAAELIAGIDMNSSWTGTDLTAVSLPQSALGGPLYVSYMYYDPTSLYPNGISGHYWQLAAATSSGINASPAYNIYVLKKLDTKMDDSKPWHGKMMLQLTCGIVSGDLDYSNANGNPCAAMVKANF